MAASKATSAAAAVALRAASETVSASIAPVRSGVKSQADAAAAAAVLDWRDTSGRWCVCDGGGENATAVVRSVVARRAVRCNLDGALVLDAFLIGTVVDCNCDPFRCDIRVMLSLL